MPDLWMDVDTALAEVPVNLMPLVDDTDFKTRETAVAYNQAGMDLVWNFVTTGGAMTQTAVTPTTGGSYDWNHQGDGMYSIEIPASGGASINNDAEGFGWFTGVCTGVLPWRGPVIGFRAAGLNNLLIDDAFSTTRGLAGTALPNAAADAAGGLPVSDAGGLDLDARLDAAVSSRLAPTTAGRTLDVSSGGEAGVDWANVGNPTTTVGLSGTTFKAVTDVVQANLTQLSGDSTLLSNMLGVLMSGAISSATTTSVTFTSVLTVIGSISPSDDSLAGMLIVAFGSSNWQTSIITAWDQATKTATVSPAFAINPSGAAIILPAALDAVGVRSAVGLAAANLDTQLSAIDDFLDTEVAAIKAKTDNLPADPADASDIAALIDALPTAAENADAVWDEARSGHTTSGTFGESFNGVVSGAAATGTLSTTEMTTDLPEATDDHYIGRIIVWLTGALAGQATDITDYVGSTKKLTYSAVTDAPSNGDRFVIV